MLSLVCATTAERDVVVAAGPQLRCWELDTLQPLASIDLDEAATALVAQGARLAVGTASGRILTTTLDARPTPPRLVHELDTSVVALGLRAGDTSPRLVVRCLGGVAYDGDGEYAYGGTLRELDWATGADTGLHVELENLGCLATAGPHALASSHRDLHLLTGPAARLLSSAHDRMVVGAAFVSVDGELQVVSADPFAMWVHSLGAAAPSSLHRDEPGTAPGLLELVAVADEEVAVARVGGVVERWHVPSRQRRATYTLPADVAGLCSSRRGLLVLTAAGQLTRLD